MSAISPLRRPRLHLCQMDSLEKRKAIKTCLKPAVQAQAVDFTGQAGKESRPIEPVARDLSRQRYPGLRDREY
jgi:hypothetical protein